MNCFATKARHRVSIQQLSTLENEYGDRTQNWDLLSEVWAIIEPKNGREIYINNQLQSNVDAIMTIRYLSALVDTTEAAKHRAVFNDREYNIKAVRNLAQDMKTEGTAYQMLICNEER